MKNIFSKHNLSKIRFADIKSFVIAHKVLSVIIILVVIFGGYKIVSMIGNTSGETHYVLSKVMKGNLISSVSSTGQVSASNQIDLKSKVSADVTSILVKSGETVTKGTIIARLDSTDAWNSLRSAQIALEKLTQPADAVNLLQAQNNLTDAIDSQNQAYDNGLNDVASAFTDIPDVLNGLDSLLGSLNGYLSSTNALYYGDTARMYRDQASSAYLLSKDKYTNLLTEYKTISRGSASSSIAVLVYDTYDTTKAISQALKESKDTIEFIKNQASSQTTSQISSASTAETNLNSWTDKINPHLESLLADKNSMDQSARNIGDKKATLDKLVKGADSLDIESAQLVLDQKAQTYSYYTIVARFDGVVGRIPVKVGDSASSGTIIATMVSKEQMADVSFNEVDASKVKVGDKAALTFDAVEGLTLTGMVSDLDLVGTANQGVVNYGAKIVFDTNDPRVLSGMSASAEVITNVLNDVLYVPSSAVRIDAKGSYVYIFNPPLAKANSAQGVPSTVAPTAESVVVGASNDTSTEIVSGLKEGDQVVVRIINPSTTTTQTPSLFGASTGGGNKTTTGGVRVTGGTGR